MTSTLMPHDPAMQVYKQPSPLKISTYTMVCNINNKVDLNILSRCISIYEPDNTNTTQVDGAFISISTYSASSMTDMPRGKLATDKMPKRVFNNELTLLYKYWGFKYINVKIFTNGMLQMTGIIDPEWETLHIANKLINAFKDLKYKVYIAGIDTTDKVHDFAICWNTVNNKLEYWRRNVESYDPDIVLINGLQYDYSNTRWYVQTDITTMITQYISKIDDELVTLEALRMQLLNTYEYNAGARQELFSKFYKYKKVYKLATDYMDLDNAKFMKLAVISVVNLIKFFKAYKLRLVQLMSTDTDFTNNISSIYNTQLPELISAGILENKTYIILDSHISLCTNYKLINIAIELINSDYNTRFNNNLIKIHELLNGPEYNIYNSYKPEERYAGIIAKFMYNPAYLDASKYKLGKCYCAKSCITEPKPVCVPVSISIFRPGSIIITSAKEIKQLVCVYDYLNAFFKKHISLISYIDIHDKRDHFLLNEERKIMRKEHLVYISRDKIIYGSI
jgi:hypothetical protein